jgi:hypothetical protein
MRIALVQMGIDPGSRAGNLARALGWIDRACAVDPSPDLVVLPAGCDGTGTGVDRLSLSASMAQAFGQSVALRAREWGTYVAVGFHRPTEDANVPAGALFDPDGDAICMLSAASSRQAGAGAPSPFALARTPLGCWSLLLGGSSWPDDLPHAFRDAGVVLAVVLGRAAAESSASLPARCEHLAREGRLHVCVAIGLSETADEPACGVWDDAGRVLSRGAAGVEELVPATVAPRPGARRPTKDRGGGADAPTAKER